MYRVDDAEEYRNRAKSCLKIIPDLTREEHKLAVLAMARAWLRLAEQAEKNRATDVVYATPGAGLPESPDPD
jgi:hypothetical protein